MKKLLDFFNGKKTAIAAFYNSVTWPAMLIVFDNNPEAWMVKTNLVVGLILVFIGVGHKVVKGKITE